MLGPFLTSGIAASMAWILVWPVEYMKAQVQSDYGERRSTWKRLKLTFLSRGGFFGLYRGLTPGVMRSFISNGSSMVVMVAAHRKVSEWGLRDD